MTEYMEPFVGEPFDAHVTGVTKFGLFVGLDNGVEGLIHVSTMEDDEYLYNEETMTLTGRFNGKQYSLGMPVRVTLVRADKDKQEVDFIMGEIHSPLNLEKRRPGHGGRRNGNRGHGNGRSHNKGAKGKGRRNRK